MTVVLDGQSYRLDADFDPDSGACYQWRGLAPWCECGEHLRVHPWDFSVSQPRPGVTVVTCQSCEREMEVA